MITNTQRIEKLRTVDPTTADVYGSVSTARLLSFITSKYNLPPGGAHIDLIGDTILGLLPKSDLTQNLVENTSLTKEQSLLLEKDLEPLFVQVPNGTDVGIRTQPTPTTPSPQVNATGNHSANPTPITKEELMASLSSLQKTPHVREEMAEETENGSENTSPVVGYGKQAEIKNSEAHYAEKDPAIPDYTKPLTGAPRYHSEEVEDRDNPQ